MQRQEPTDDSRWIDGMLEAGADPDERPQPTKRRAVDIEDDVGSGERADGGSRPGE